MTKTLFAAVGATVFLSACSLFEKPAPIVDFVDQAHAQRLAVHNSLIGEACDGHHVSHGQDFGNNPNDYVVRVSLHEADNLFVLQELQSTATPANRGVTKKVDVVVNDRHPLRCTGMATKTAVVNSGSGDWIKYDLEVALDKHSSPETRPYRISGLFEIDSKGEGVDRKAFEVGGSRYIAVLHAVAAPKSADFVSVLIPAENTVDHWEERQDP